MTGQPLSSRTTSSLSMVRMPNVSTPRNPGPPTRLVFRRENFEVAVRREHSNKPMFAISFVTGGRILLTEDESKRLAEILMTEVMG